MIPCAAIPRSSGRWSSNYLFRRSCVPSVPISQDSCALCLARCVGLRGSVRAACAPQHPYSPLPARVLRQRAHNRGRCASACRRAPPPPTSARAMSEGAMRRQLHAPSRGIYPPPSQRPRALHLACRHMGFLCRVPPPLRLTLRVFTPSAAGGAHGACIRYARSACGPWRHSWRASRVPPLHTHRSRMAPRAAVQRPQDPGEYPPLQVVYPAAFLLQLHPQRREFASHPI
ncbi:hypothetical protein FB451DRAFT_1551277 [Mycena latifolia]|nr:hypothetical protein FB451DRAFT_1551277 [Mycena latifolia]